MGTDPDQMSVAQRVARLSPEDREKALEGLDPEELKWNWQFWGRPAQTPPEDGSWNLALMMGGRGSGKTRASTEWVREKAKTPGTRFIIAARTAKDVRDTLIQGDSGLMNIHPPSEGFHYSPANARVNWANGSTGVLLTAEEPDSFRGPQGHYALADEVAARNQKPDGAGMTAWQNLRIATRLGDHPQIMAATTPKRTQMLYDLMEEKEQTGKIWLSHSTTFDNAGNLADVYLEQVTGLFEGTSLAAQELEGMLLGEAEGALWSLKNIDDTRVKGVASIGSLLRVVAVDPSVADSPKDECGIVVVGSSMTRELHKREMYVLEDASLLASPGDWAREVVRMAQKWRCPVVAETNQGGALVRSAIHAIDPTIKVYEVHSKYGKALRAEPVTLAYEQERVHHVGVHAMLESQMTTWIPGDTKKSPDRVDALVHGITALSIRPPKGFSGGGVTAKSMSQAMLGNRNRGRRGR